MCIMWTFWLAWRPLRQLLYINCTTKIRYCDMTILVLLLRLCSPTVSRSMIHHHCRCRMCCNVEGIFNVVFRFFTEQLGMGAVSSCSGYTHVTCCTDSTFLSALLIIVNGGWWMMCTYLKMMDAYGWMIEIESLNECGDVFRSVK